ncbi:MAG: hypothetical protein N2316_02430 [Spirochaetes bacterium]|nr:hypothetical protein [Spirochaetota bacterium]
MVEERFGNNNRPKEKDVSSTLKSIRGVDTRSIAVKGGIALAVVLALFLVYILVVSVPRAKVRFVLTDYEVQNLEQDIESQKTFALGGKIFFLINRRNGKELNATHVVLEIAKIDEDKTGSVKQISFDIDKDFTKLTTFIPVDYFKKKGKYLVKAFLDGKPFAEEEISVE